MLFGVAEAYREPGLKIPAQVGIAGSTGIPVSETSTPLPAVSETPMKKNRRNYCLYFIPSRDLRDSIVSSRPSLDETGGW